MNGVETNVVEVSVCLMLRCYAYFSYCSEVIWLGKQTFQREFRFRFRDGHQVWWRDGLPQELDSGLLDKVQEEIQGLLGPQVMAVQVVMDRVRDTVVMLPVLCDNIGPMCNDALFCDTGIYFCVIYRWLPVSNPDSVVRSLSEVP